MSRLSQALLGGTPPGSTRRGSGIGNVRFANFFDREKVISAVTAAERRVLNHAGALTRKIARQSMRRRKKISDPETPPSARVGLLKKFLFYRYEPQTGSVIVGPAKLTNRDNYSVPEILEHGGTVTIRRNGKSLRQKFRRRPFMQPALEKVAPMFPELWRDQIVER